MRVSVSGPWSWAAPIQLGEGTVPEPRASHCLYHTPSVHHHCPAPSTGIASLGLPDLWVPTASLQTYAPVPRRPGYGSKRLFSHMTSSCLGTWHSGCVPLAMCHTQFHTLVLKVSSLLPVSEMTFLLLHMLKDPSICLMKEKCTLWIELYVLFPLHVLKPQCLRVPVPQHVSPEIRPL